MFKKIVISTLIGSAIAFIAWGIFFLDAETPNTQTTYDIIPADYDYIININEYKNFYNGLNRWGLEQRVSQIDQLKFVQPKIQCLDSLYKLPITPFSLDQIKIIHFPKGFAFLGKMKMPTYNLEDLKAFFEENFNMTTNISNNIIELKIGDEKLFAGLWHRIIFISNEENFIDKKHLTENKQQEIQALIKEKGNKNAAMNLILKKGEKLQDISSYKTNAASIYDVYFKSNGVHLSGWMPAQTSGMNAIDQDVFQYTPANTSEVHVFSYEKEFIKKQLAQKTTEYNSWIGSEIALMVNDQDSLLMVQSASGIDPMDALEEINLEGSGLSQSDSLLVEEYANYTIRKNYQSEFYNKKFKSFDDKLNINPKWFMFINDKIIFSGHKNSLKTYADQFSKGEILSENEQFSSMYSHYSVDSITSTYYAQQNPISEFNLLKILTSGRQFATFSKINKDELITNLFSQQKKQFTVQQAVKKSGLLWKTQLQSIKEVEKSGWYYNHRTNLYNLLIQNQDHVLYSINEKGKLRWKYEVKAPINSDFKTVDLYRNNKNQIVFHTKQKIYILDVLGRNVNNYPAKTEAKITSPIALLDYDNDGTFRVLAGLKNGSIASFNKQGEVVDGWNFERGKNAIVSPVKHTAFNGYDYLHFVDAEGHLYATGRRGENRLQQKVHLPNFKYQGCSFNKEDRWKTSYYRYVARNGIIHTVYLNNKHDSIPLEQAKAVKVWDFDFNSKKDEIFWLTTTLNKIQVFSNLGLKTFGFAADVTTIKNLSFVKLKKHNNFVFLDVEKNKAFLLNDFGEIAEGYPIKASKGFWHLDQRLRKTPIMITFEGKNLICKPFN